tara:strand:+ start:1860 stop:3692 length:1833 start_codon:yes stop_codon:yes gene_type:complete
VGELFGSDADKQLGRDAMSGVERQIADQTEELAIDGDRQRELELERVRSAFQEQREQLSRQFALQPGGEQSGNAQRAFEQLASAEANALINAERQVDQQVRDQATQNIQTLTAVQESREAAALQQGNFALSREDLDLRTRSQATSEGFQERAQDLQEQGMGLEAEKVRQAGEQLAISSEQFNAQLDLSAQELGLNREQVEASLAQGQQRLNAEINQMEQAGTLDFQRLGLDRDVFQATIEQQQLDRATQDMQFSKQLDLSVAEFNQMSMDSDRVWEQTVSQAGIDNNLNERQFAMAIDELQNDMTLKGRQMDLAVDEFGLAREGQEFAQDVQVRQMDFQDEAFQEQMRDSARKHGLAEDQFMTAARQWQDSFNAQQDQLAVSNGLQAEEWALTRNTLERRDNEHEMFWDGMMAGKAGAVDVTLDSLGGQGAQVIQRDVTALDEQTVRDALGDMDIGDDFQEWQNTIADWSSMSDADIRAEVGDGFGADQMAKMMTRQRDRSLEQVEALREAGVLEPRVQATTVEEVIRMTKETHGVDVTPDQANDILLGSPVNIQRDPKDWINSFNQDQRAQLLALMSGGVYSGGKDRKVNFWEAAGGLAGQLGAAYLNK